MAAAVAAFLFLPNPTPKQNVAVRSRISLSTPLLSLNPPPSFSPSLSPSPSPPWTLKSSVFRPAAAVQDVAVEEEEKVEIEEEEGKRGKFYVTNIPWDITASAMEDLFGVCGTVHKVEIMKQKNGRSRGFAFVTMASQDEVKAAVEKFDSYELSGRIIRVEPAKNFSKPSPAPQVAPVVETRHKIFVSNLAWKVRSLNLRNFFSTKFKTVSARVVFDSPSGRSAGYGFVSFDTKEEAEAALSEFDGKELMGRPLRLRMSQPKGSESVSETENPETSPETSDESQSEENESQSEEM